MKFINIFIKIMPFVERKLHFSSEENKTGYKKMKGKYFPERWENTLTNFLRHLPHFFQKMEHKISAYTFS